MSGHGTPGIPVTGWRTLRKDVAAASFRLPDIGIHQCRLVFIVKDAAVGNANTRTGRVPTPAADGPPRPVPVMADSGDEIELASFRVLQDRVRRAGLLESRSGYYAAKILANVCAMVAGWVLFAIVGDSWWQLAIAAYLGFWNVQIGLVGHDAGHLQILRGRRASGLLNYLHQNLLLGVSAGWWVSYHNRHHSHPNHLTKDPQVAGRPIVVALGESNQSVSWPRRQIIRHQAGLFFPMFLFYSAGMRAASVVALWRGRAPRIAVEAALIVLHFGAYLAALVAVLPGGKLAAFIVVQHVVIGVYLGAIFSPNHRGMQVHVGDEPDWLHRQVLTARNLRSTWLTHFLFGGLNYHIEHHLFPAMPRPQLRQARPIVIAFCRENGLPYYEVTVFRSYTEIVTYLAGVSRAWQRRCPAAQRG